MELLHLLSPRDDLLTAGMDEQPASDPSALVRIIVVLCMIFAWLVMAARIELRRPLSKKFRLDDWMTLVATVLALAQQVVVMMGLPRKQTAAAAGGMDDAMTYTGDLLYVITLFAAKIAVPMLFLRLVASQREHFLVVSLLIGGLVLGLPAFILVAAQEARDAMFRHWTAIELLAVLYETFLIAYPFLLTTHHCSKKLPPFRAIFFALLRLPTIGLAILRIVSLSLSLQAPPDDPSQPATTALIMQIQMTYNVIAASLICLAFTPTPPAETPLLPTTTELTPATPAPPPAPFPEPAPDLELTTTNTPSYDRSPKHHPRSYFRFLRKKSAPDRPSAMHALQMSLTCDSAWTVTRAERGRAVEYSSLLEGLSTPGEGNGKDGKRKGNGMGKDDIVVVSTVEVKFEEKERGN